MALADDSAKVAAAAEKALAAGDARGAEKLTRPSLSADRLQPALLRLVVRSLVAQRRLSAAESALLRLMDSGQAGAEDWVLMGNIRRMSGQLDSSESAFRRALQSRDASLGHLAP